MADPARGRLGRRELRTQAPDRAFGNGPNGYYYAAPARLCDQLRPIAGDVRGQCQRYGRLDGRGSGRTNKKTRCSFEHRVLTVLVSEGDFLGFLRSLPANEQANSGYAK